AIQSHSAPMTQQQPVTASSNNNAVPPPMSLPKSQYIAIAQQDATNAGISPTYFVRQINQESGFNPNAVSPAGAEGIAQFEPGTAAGLGIDPWNPVQSLQAAAHLMANYSSNYGGNYAMALAAYNGGPGTVTYAVNTCGASNWLNCLPYETRHYIYVIMGI
ncbi:MAG TPA: lytic transglycosylase domain-containing protein, partial [Chthonomonadales bacterium]|nr:lytic transglycosylase domain-containing protein [Chthonomonadales bacterium]